MRRLLLIISMTLAICVVKAQDYRVDLSNNKRMIISVDYSALNWSKNNVAGITTSINLFGVYADVGFNTQGNFALKRDGKQHDGYKVMSYHLGYTIPISHRFRLTPVLGYMHWQRGVYDSTKGGGFTPSAQERCIDYGFRISYEVFEAFCVSATLQRHIIGFGIGLCFNASDWGA